MTIAKLTMDSIKEPGPDNTLMGKLNELTDYANGVGTAAPAHVTDLEIDGALNHDGTTVGFYGTTPIVKQTGVAVSTAAIHAALVALGLIGA